jgi:hypothetical protein
MKEINLRLTIEEINLVLAALGRMPFQEVYALVHKIHVQSTEQWEKSPEEMPAEFKQNIEEENE